MDHLGTPRELVDEAGAIAWSASYRLWGGVRGLWTRAVNDNDPLVSGGPSGLRSGKIVTDQLVGSGYNARPVSYSTQGNTALNLSSQWDASAEALAALPDAKLYPIRFQGQWEDRETGLYYNRFRTYDPQSAQYLSGDPIGLEGGLRSGGYVDVPTQWIDVSGLRPCNQILNDIFSKTKSFHAEMLKYNPLTDVRGGFPSYRSGRLKITKPGGHYQKLRNYQQGIVNNLDEYAKSQCYKCASKNDMLKIGAASRVVATEVPVPATIPRIPLSTGP